MYHWPSRRSSTRTVSPPVAKVTPLSPPARPATTPPSLVRPPKRTPSFGAVVIHRTPPPRSPAQLRATLDPARVGPTRMPSYVGSLLDAFSVDSLGETSLDLDRSFEVSPRTSYRDPPPVEEPSTTISEESHTSSPQPAPPTAQFEGLQLTLSLPNRPFSMGTMPDYITPRSPSPTPSRPRTPAQRRIRLDSAEFEKPPQSFSAAVPPEMLRRRSCILNCVRKGVKKAVRKQ